MGQSKSIDQNGFKIEMFSKQSFSDELINQQFYSCVMVLKDFISYYKENQKIHLGILEKLLKNLCIEEECLKRLKITLDEDKNEFFYNENLFIYSVFLQTIKMQLNQKKPSSTTYFEDIFADALSIYRFKKEQFFQYPFYFFCELLKFSVIHIIVVHFISLNKTDVFSLYQKYFFLAYHQLLDGLLSRIGMITPTKEDVYSNHSQKLRNSHEISVQFFQDRFSQISYVTKLENDNDISKDQKQVYELNTFRNQYINKILLSYGQSRAVELISIFNMLSDALNYDKLDYQEMRKQLQNEQQEYHNQIYSTIPQFLNSVQEVIYMKNTQKKEINDMKKIANKNNLEYLFNKLEKIQKEFNPMETNSLNNQNGNDTQDDTLSKVSHIFSNKHINIYNHYNKQLIMEDESGFKIRVNQALQVLDEQIEECEETIERNNEYKKQYKTLLNQIIHKIKIFKLIEQKCFQKVCKSGGGDK